MIFDDRGESEREKVRERERESERAFFSRKSRIFRNKRESKKKNSFFAPHSRFLFRRKNATEEIGNVRKEERKEERKKRKEKRETRCFLRSNLGEILYRSDCLRSSSDQGLLIGPPQQQ